jgi:hypothetical protein
MLKRIKYISFFYFIIYCFALSGQDLKSDLSNEINVIRQKKNSAINEQILLKYNNKILLDSLKKYDNDTSLIIRFNIQQLEYKIALNNPMDTAIQKEVVNRLIDGIKDADALVRQNAIKKLLTFSYIDFDKKAIDSLKKIIEDCKLNKDLILLIGVANIQEQKDYFLSNIKTNPINKLSEFYSPDWAMQLALARMGNVESIDYCIKNVENFNDTIKKITVLLDDIGYIRREPAVIYLKKYLYNTNRLPSVKETDKGTQYCQYALDVLANIIEDFPIKAQGIGYTDEEIEIAKKWLESNSQYKIKR